MINDSDEEVLYGSDTEELLNLSGPIDIYSPEKHQSASPNVIHNLIDTRNGEESD